MGIKRIKCGERMSQAVVHNGIVSTAGQVAQNAKGGTVTAQTQDILAAIDALLKEGGTDKSSLLTATIWLRACVESKLASPDFTVEIAVTAAT